MDWVQMRDGEGERILNVLVGIDHLIAQKFAIAAEDKLSNNVETIRAVLTALRRFGHHGTVELQCDNEPALMALLRNVAVARDVPTLISNSPPFESQSNGRAESCSRN